jgi:hypothetical protein
MVPISFEGKSDATAEISEQLEVNLKYGLGKI